MNEGRDRDSSPVLLILLSALFPLLAVLVCPLSCAPSNPLDSLCWSLPSPLPLGDWVGRSPEPWERDVVTRGLHCGLICLFVRWELGRGESSESPVEMPLVVVVLEVSEALYSLKSKKLNLRCAMKLVSCNAQMCWRIKVFKCVLLANVSDKYDSKINYLQCSMH